MGEIETCKEEIERITTDWKSAAMMFRKEVGELLDLLVHFKTIVVFGAVYAWSDQGLQLGCTRASVNDHGGPWNSKVQFVRTSDDRYREEWVREEWKMVPMVLGGVFSWHVDRRQRVYTSEELAVAIAGRLHEFHIQSR